MLISLSIFLLFDLPDWTDPRTSLGPTQLDSWTSSGSLFASLPRIVHGQLELTPAMWQSHAVGVILTGHVLDEVVGKVFAPLLLAGRQHCRPLGVRQKCGRLRWILVVVEQRCLFVHGKETALLARPQWPRMGGVSLHLENAWVEGRVRHPPVVLPELVRSIIARIPGRRIANLMVGDPISFFEVQKLLHGSSRKRKRNKNE